MVHVPADGDAQEVDRRPVATGGPDAEALEELLVRRGMRLLQGDPAAVLGRPDTDEVAFLDPGIRKTANAVDPGRPEIEKGPVPFTLTHLAVVSTFTSSRAFCPASGSRATVFVGRRPTRL